MEDKMDQVTSNSTNHEQAVQALQEEVWILEDAHEDLNNRSRRNNIRIKGLSESVTIDTLSATLRETFWGEAPPALALYRLHTKDAQHAKESHIITPNP
ncbi:Hypothetical predicted protein [Pelobates cultripes]|uniref:Uncharacterized protein n=1 Tax=Pelobates cultripes TaxID=61616 RepID=A0AAD1RNP7_PELCU|nr:Hypothetical predicted protein [Pelobates cultripes]